MRRARQLRRGSASLILSALGGFVALSLAVAAPHTAREEGIKLALSDAGGSLTLTNSLEGSAILGAAGMRPGDQTVGSVRIGNSGTVTGALMLQASSQGSTSPAGGSMWSRLQIAIADTTDAQHPIGLYNGPLESLAQISVGALPAGQQHEFRFIVTLPNGAPVIDNAYQGAGSSILFTWTATGEEPVTPTPTATPAAPSPTPAPTPQQDVRDDNANSASADSLLRLPSSKRCLSARKFTIHLVKKKGTTIKSAVVYVNGKTKVKVKGKKKLRAAINLRGLPAGKVKVKIVLTTTKSKKLVSTRTYKTCKAKPLTEAQKKKAKAKAKAKARAKALAKARARAKAKH
jgi:hypothetical protein